MPTLTLADGTGIHWEQRGRGPLVVLAISCLSSPAVFAALVDGLACDHRVVVYDPRGFGRSTRNGPYDPATDASDLAQLLDHLGEAGVVIATGDGCLRAVRVAAAHPERVRAVVTPGGNPLGRAATAGTDALAASRSVLDVLLETMRADFRAGLRMAIGPANPQLDEAGVRERVDAQAAYAPREATLERLRCWMSDTAPREAIAIGDRLWLVEHPNNPWFPLEVARATRGLLPEAHVLEVEDGPLSRPDLTVEVVASLTGAAAPGAGAEASGAAPRS